MNFKLFSFLLFSFFNFNRSQTGKSIINWCFIKYFRKNQIVFCSICIVSDCSVQNVQGVCQPTHTDCLRVMPGSTGFPSAQCI